MNVFFTVLVTFFAGMGAGLGTGFAGMSAAAVISPMPVSYTHLDVYKRQKLYTTQPGIQLYTGNFLQACPTPGKGGVPMQQYEIGRAHV